VIVSVKDKQEVPTAQQRVLGLVGRGLHSFTFQLELRTFENHRSRYSST
jgi:hypothetical protein